MSVIVTSDTLSVFLKELTETALGDVSLHAAVNDALNNYLLDFDYEKIKFNTDDTLSNGATSGVLGVGQLGLMVLGSS